MTSDPKRLASVLSHPATRRISVLCCAMLFRALAHQARRRWHQVLQVADVGTKDVRRNPLPPFTTSTMQQDASSRLGFSPSSTMQLAQQLYEGSASSQGEHPLRPSPCRRGESPHVKWLSTVSIAQIEQNSLQNMHLAPGVLSEWC